MIYQIVHSIAGRLRIRIPKLIQDLEFAGKLTGLIESLACVTSVRMNAAAGCVTITYREASSTLVEQEILTCIQTAIGIDSSEEPSDAELEPEINHWKDLGMPVLSLGVALLAAPLELPAIVVGAAIAGAALPWFARATDSLTNHRQPNIDLLDSVWMTLQTMNGQYAAPALKTCLVEVRRSLRGTVAEQREQQALEFLTSLDQEVSVDRNGQELRIAASQLQRGDRVVFRAGDRIPVDGWILQGTALINEQSLTDDSTPVICTEGQEVFASSVVLEGELWIVVEQTGLSTRIGYMAHLMKSAPVHDTHLGVLQGEFVRSAIVPTLFLGGTIFALTGNVGAAISPFQLDFGSGIPISVHTTLLSALTYAARQGIYIRSARVLEHLTQLDAIVLDDSGLMTHPDGKSTIDALHDQGIATYWVTQHDFHDAIELADHFGIGADHVFAETHSGTNLIQGLQHHGKTVAFVGECADSQADVSIAVLAQPNVECDVVLTGDLAQLISAIDIATRAIELVYQNTAIIVVPNLIVQIGGGMFLGMHPVINVITNNSSAFVAEFVQGSHSVFDQPHLLKRRCLAPTPKESCSDDPPLLKDGSPVFVADAPFLKQCELAKRLGVSSQAITPRRSTLAFVRWTQAKDPEGKGWQYDAAAKRFYVVSLEQWATTEAQIMLAHAQRLAQSATPKEPQCSEPDSQQMTEFSTHHFA